MAIVPAVAANVAVVPAAPTVTEAGTVNPAALLASATVAPPVFDSVTVHVELPPDPTDAGVQLSAVRVGGTGAAVTVPPEPLMGSEVPLAETPNVPVTPIVVLVTAGAMVTLTTATTPFCITVVLKPASKHR